MDFIIENQFQPLLALILIGISTALLGVFVLWKKLSFFGDAISHSILLGAALGAIIGFNQSAILLIFAAIFAALVAFATNNRYFSKDTIIAISSYFCVALAIILNDLTNNNIDFSQYLFGEIEAITISQILTLAIIGIFSIIFVFFAKKTLLLINISPDLAKIENIKISLWNFIFMILLTLIIAIAVQIVGILLMTALLILPASIARLFAKNADQMLLLSLLISICVCALSCRIATQFSISISALTILFFSAIFIPTILLKK